ncbi:MAG: sulfatase [Planctomycetota bacterium]|nr:MAG: sulfatase [Planctomycetota bacterium]
MVNLNRREFLNLVAGGAAAMISSSGCDTELVRSGDIAKRPNIIFIMADDHAAQAMSCYGSKINRTPNLDRLAKQGMLFENCFCTNSICAPSRAVILTGKYSHINGVINNKLTFDGTQQTFPKLLQKAGYQTAVIGKWHLRSEPTGFDHYDILIGSWGQGEYFDPLFSINGQERRTTGYVTDIITDKCLEWLKKQKSDKPFCLMYQHKAPHRAWEPDERHAKMYDGIDIPEPTTFNDDYETRSDAARQQEMTIEHHLTPSDLKVKPPEELPGEERRDWDKKGIHGEYWSPSVNLWGQPLKKWKYQQYIKDYLRCIASIDDNVGRLLDYLDQAGLTESTIVIYTSDQGFYLGEHGWFDKRFMYEESLRMPLLVRYPREIKAGSVNGDIVLNLDFAPTLLDFASVANSADMQGRSFRKLLQGSTPENWRTSMYYHYYEYPGWHAVKRHYGVRTNRYKLIHFYYDIDAWELYDLHKDPNELNNVYDNPAYKSVLRQLKDELNRLRRQYGDSDELTRAFLED